MGAELSRDQKAKIYLQVGQEHAQRAHEKARNELTPGERYSRNLATEELGFLPDVGIDTNKAKNHIELKNFSFTPGGEQQIERANIWKAHNDEHAARIANGEMPIYGSYGEKPIWIKPLSGQELRDYEDRMVAETHEKVANIGRDITRVEGGFQMRKDGDYTLTNAVGYCRNEADKAKKSGNLELSEEWERRAEGALEIASDKARAAKERIHIRKCEKHGFDPREISHEEMNQFALAKAGTGTKRPNSKQLDARDAILRLTGKSNINDALMAYKPKGRDQEDITSSNSTRESQREAQFPEPISRTEQRQIVAQENKESSQTQHNQLVEQTSRYNLTSYSPPAVERDLPTKQETPAKVVLSTERKELEKAYHAAYRKQDNSHIKIANQIAELGKREKALASGDGTMLVQSSSAKETNSSVNKDVTEANKTANNISPEALAAVGSALSKSLFGALKLPPIPETNKTIEVPTQQSEYQTVSLQAKVQMPEVINGDQKAFRVAFFNKFTELSSQSNNETLDVKNIDFKKCSGELEGMKSFMQDLMDKNPNAANDKNYKAFCEFLDRAIESETSYV